MLQGIFRRKSLNALLTTAEEGHGFGTLKRSLGAFQLTLLAFGSGDVLQPTAGDSSREVDLGFHRVSLRAAAPVGGGRVQASLAFGTDLPIGALWDGNEQQARTPGILTFLAGGNASRETRQVLAAEGEAGIVRRLTWLGRPSTLLASKTIVWDDDPWVGGGYAYFDPGFDPLCRASHARLRTWTRTRAKISTGTSKTTPMPRMNVVTKERYSEARS